MLVGPIFARELVTAPRRNRLYLLRGVYGGALVLLVCTAWLVMAGTQVVRSVGDLARFGGLVFQILAPLQLAIAIFFAALAAASSVGQEKDRRTFELLLLSRLTNSELVLGRLLASLLNILTLLVVALPISMLTLWLGGVSPGQVLRVSAVTLVSALLAGSLGSTIALWRERTFQSLALTVLAIVCWLGWWEAVGQGALGGTWLGVSTADWALVASPWRALLVASEPHAVAAGTGSAWGPAGKYLATASGLGLLLNLLAVWRVRVWNPSREQRQSSQQPREEPLWGESAAASGGATARELAAAGTSPVATSPHAERGRAHRVVWRNPILWREVRTAAYGRRMAMIRVVYCLLFGAAAYGLWLLAEQPAGLTRATAAWPLLPLLVLSLVLINAQAVTAITSERDTRALDLLLVTDLSPPELIFGKLGGVFYNTKAMWLLPLGLMAALWWWEAIDLENLLLLWGGYAVLAVFVAVLGLHCGMTYANSAGAVAASLGTVFFLFLGVAVCMRLMIAFSGSFQTQLQPFLAFMLGGGIGLYVTLGVRNPSSAIAAASLLCPFATFYALTSFLLGHHLAVFLVTTGMYGFTTASLLIPAIYEFDVAAGRTTTHEE